MSEANQSFAFTQIVNVPVEQAYFAFTNATALQSWLCNTAEIVANENGRIYLWWDVGYASSGVFQSVAENEKVQFSWHGFGEPAPTTVEATFTAQDEGTLVTVTHSGLGEGESWQQMRESIQKDWPNALENLQTHLEQGVDKRVYDRPMLGVFVGGLLDEAQAESLGIPVTTGVVLSGVVDEMGAQAAGIEQNDVLVELAGQEITDFASVGTAIGDYKAGDTAVFTVYRGAEKMTFDVELGRRPLPEQPATAAGLAEQVQTMYEELDSELDAVFAEASEEEASKRPVPTEWSAKETIAHLLYTERWTQISISTAVGGQKFPGFHNDLGVIAAMANAYPTMDEIITALKRAEATTVAAIENLPDDFVANKGRYLLFNGIIQFTPGHNRQHFQQMREAIQAARG